MLRVLLVVLWLPWHGLAAQGLYAGAGTPTGHFLSLDRDEDGFLDQRELSVVPQWAREADSVDRDGNALIDHREFLRLLDRLGLRR